MNAKQRADFVVNVHRVLQTGKDWNDSSLHFPADDAINIILTLPGMQKDSEAETRGPDGFDTNGWQWDWWQRFLCDGKRYVLGGSGYYGGHAFYLSDEQ